MFSFFFKLVVAMLILSAVYEIWQSVTRIYESVQLSSKDNVALFYKLLQRHVLDKDSRLPQIKPQKNRSHGRAKRTIYLITPSILYDKHLRERACVCSTIKKTWLVWNTYHYPLKNLTRRFGLFLILQSREVNRGGYVRYIRTLYRPGQIHLGHGR